MCKFWIRQILLVTVTAAGLDVTAEEEGKEKLKNTHKCGGQALGH